ncbi:MAG: DUF4129 domain-containing protein [Rubripirellula sp.]
MTTRFVNFSKAIMVLACLLCGTANAQSPTKSLTNQPAGTEPTHQTQVDDQLVKDSIIESIWYDAEEGVVPIHVKPEVDDSLNRESRWLPKPKKIAKPAANTPANTTTTGTGSGLFGSGFTLANLLGWLVLVAIVAGVVGTIAYTLSKAELDLTTSARATKGNKGTLPDDQTIERMKHLPAELRRTDVNLRTEAERLMNQGEYDQALILLFGHQLLLLDRVGMMRLNRGKTNRKYVRETRSKNVEASKRLQQTVIAFERSYFGRHTIPQPQFAELWQSNETLEEAVRHFQEVAT